MEHCRALLWLPNSVGSHVAKTTLLELQSWNRGSENAASSTAGM